jgi:hypothetical protein
MYGVPLTDYPANTFANGDVFGFGTTPHRRVYESWQAANKISHHSKTPVPVVSRAIWAETAAQLALLISFALSVRFNDGSTISVHTLCEVGVWAWLNNYSRTPRLIPS